jgi:hypothetical protein
LQDDLVFDRSAPQHLGGSEYESTAVGSLGAHQELAAVGGMTSAGPDALGWLVIR